MLNFVCILATFSALMTWTHKSVSVYLKAWMYHICDRGNGSDRVVKTTDQSCNHNGFENLEHKS
jgi:hypothetical protein